MASIYRTLLLLALSALGSCRAFTDVDGLGVPVPVINGSLDHNTQTWTGYIVVPAPALRPDQAYPALASVEVTWSSNLHDGSKKWRRHLSWKDGNVAYGTRFPPGAGSDIVLQSSLIGSAASTMRPPRGTRFVGWLTVKATDVNGDSTYALERLAFKSLPGR